MTAVNPPLQSMTGFAAVDGSLGEATWTWSLKSVNGKSLDIRWRMPSRMDVLEQSLRKALQGEIARGSVSASLQLELPNAKQDVQVNQELYDRLSAFAQDNGDGMVSANPAEILRLPGVLETTSSALTDEEQAELNKGVLKSFSEAAKALKDARLTEGAQLSIILHGLVEQIETHARDAEASADAVSLALAERLKTVAADLVQKAGASLPEERLAQEAAILATKADVREELDRLHAHIASARELLGSGAPVGRKLDFLAQEFMREANTLCSKAGSMELTNIGLALKSVVDQFKEQVANVE